MVSSGLRQVQPGLLPVIHVLSAVIALLSLAWSYTALEKARANRNYQNFKLKSTISYFISQLAVLVSRLISIVTFAQTMKSGVFFLNSYCSGSLCFFTLHLFCVTTWFSCYRGDIDCCDSSTGIICSNLMLTLPLTFFLSESVLESFGFDALWIKMLLFNSRTGENLLMLIIAARSPHHSNIWMPIA